MNVWIGVAMTSRFLSKRVVSRKCPQSPHAEEVARKLFRLARSQGFFLTVVREVLDKNSRHVLGCLYMPVWFTDWETCVCVWAGGL